MSDPAPQPAGGSRLAAAVAVVLCALTGAATSLAFQSAAPAAPQGPVVEVKAAPAADPAPAPAPSAPDDGPTRQVWLPKAGRFATFTPRDKMRAGHPARRPGPMVAAPPTPLPINWYGSLAFPIDGNDRYGDCGEAMAAHGDNTFTGMNGAESVFNVSALVAQYFKYSGGDNGLSEGDVISLWKAGIAGVKDATIYDALDIDPLNAAEMRAAVHQFGGICLAFSCPDAWLHAFDPKGGVIWDAPAVADPNNGHFVWINGVDAQGMYHVETWGSSVWMTPRGLAQVDPSAFTVFSPRWFNPKTGMNPAGLTYPAAAQAWASAGGGKLPPSPFPAPTPPPTPAPIPTPSPAPSPVAGSGTYAVTGSLTLTPITPSTPPPAGMTYTVTGTYSISPGPTLPLPIGVTPSPQSPR